MTATAAVRVEELPDGRQVPAIAGAVGAIAPIGMPSVIDVKALERALAIIEDPKWLELQKRFANAFDVACKQLLSDNDIQKEGKGDNAREFKKKSAWRKLGKHFGVSTRVVGELVYEVVGKVVVARVTVEGVSSWGHSTQAVGACGTDEESGRRKISLADAVATAETRATNRAISNLIAMGEVSYEEVAKNQVAEEGVKDLTLEDAKVYPFPWKKPEKYAGKPMGNLSHNMLDTVLNAINAEIEKNGETPKRLELRRVCALLLDDMEDRAAGGDGVEDEQRLNPTSEPSSPATSNDGSTAPTATKEPAVSAAAPTTPASAEDKGSSFADEFSGYGEQLPRHPQSEATEPKGPPPAKGDPDSIYALGKRFNQLIDHPAIPEELRESAQREAHLRSTKPGYATYLQQQVTAAEQVLAGALDEKELAALGITPAAREPARQPKRR